MSEVEGRVIDKRTVVRVGLSNRSGNAASVGRISSSQPPPSTNNLQFIKIPMNDSSSVRSADEKSLRNSADLSYRSSPYRKKYGDLSDGHITAVNYKIEDDSNDGHMAQDSNEGSDDQSTPLSGHAYQIISGDGSVVDDTNLQPLALKNISANNMQTPGTTVVQYTQDGQLFIPVHQLNQPNLVFSPGLMVSNAGPASAQHLTVEESCKKRELRLLKNKEAAKECRRKKKEYVKCLENRVAVLENQNKTLIEELKSLKELYCQKDVHS